MSALNSTFKCSIKMIRTADSNVEKLLLIQVALINTTHLSLSRIKMLQLQENVFIGLQFSIFKFVFAPN